jgi:hypothetical protein
MKSLNKLLVFLLFTSSLLISQEKQSSENHYPKFNPYIAEKNITVKQKRSIDIKDLGKAQPARWLSVDPKADKYPSWSPYNYALNNPLKYIDPHGDTVWVYAQRLGSETFSNGNKSWLEATIGYLSRPDHSIVRMKTDDFDKTIEFTGKGEVLFNNTDLNRISGYESNLVQEPFSDLLKPGQSENFDYENKLLETANVINHNQKLLPKYDYMESNCNGFANAFIQSAGGKAEFSRGAFFYNNISPFARSFDSMQRIANSRR